MTHTNKQKSGNKRNRGVALITALLLLSLFTVMTLAMVIATTSDTLIDGYYRNARGSFYAADSGMNAARQYLANQILASLPTTYTPSGGSPVLTPTAATILTNLESSSSGFGAYKSTLGSQTGSWPETFSIDSSKTSFTMASCTPTPQCSNGSTTPVTAATPYVYNFAYHLTVNGQARSSEVNVVEEWGVIPFIINMNPTSTTTTSFAAYGTLFDQYALCSAPFVAGTMSGPFFSNQSWNFGDSSALGSSTKYIFTGNVGAVNSQVGYFHGNSCYQSSATSDTHNGTTINPTFSGGLSLGQTAIPMPTDSYNQERAVLDGLGGCGAATSGGTTCTAPTSAQLAAVLKNAAGTAWSTSATSGVFLPWNGSSALNLNTTALTSGNSPTNQFGGLYVQGNVDQMTLTASTISVSGNSHKAQVITIKQGSAITTVTLDLTAGTTRIQDNSSHDSGALPGLPENVTSGSPTEGCLVYVTGNISSNPSATAPTGLSGPSSGAAIQDGSGVTVTSGGTISVTGDIKYSTEPVSLTTADTAVSPAPTNVFGIFTNGGNVQIQPSSNVSTMEIDASIATISNGGSGGIIAQWNTIGTLNIVGGRVQNKALSGASLGSRNIYFDQRFANGFAPPWFPTTTITTSTTNTASPQQPKPIRLSWVNSSAQ
jgi:Tfp pilus assembly protein PilX